MTISEKDPVRDGVPASGVDPVRLAIALEVFEELDQLPVDHPQAVAVRRATARLYKTVKMRNRKEKRESVVAADEAVTAATATGAPGRIDDETRGLALAATASVPIVGVLGKARACYICKDRYREVDA
ncbi:MAG TPA: hypothetical protein VK662_02740, partial [Acidothermaceae bacterium]|nr:hypothetical protein [Acidothermaceae bacterium]